MAGNIIPAIASTNAIVGGFIVMTAFKVLKEDWFKCNSVYIQNRVNVRKELYHFDQVMAPNPKCYVCGDKPEVRSLKYQLCVHIFILLNICLNYLACRLS